MIRKDNAKTQELVDELSDRIKTILSKYENVIEFLKEIPGFRTKMVEDLVVEIGFDISHFPPEKHLASWQVSVQVTMRVQAKKWKNYSRKQTSESGHYRSRWLATRTKYIFFSERYHRITTRRGKKRALIAVGHF